MQLDDHPTVKAYREKMAKGEIPLRDEKLDSDWLRALALDAGADDVGFVDIDRTAIADERDDILEAFPKTLSFMALICKLNPENIRCVSRSVSDLEYLQTFEAVNSVAKKVGSALHQKGVSAANPSAGFPMDTARWPGKMWPVSHKRIAVEAGLGAIGHHRIVIHPRFGSFVILGTVLLDKEITAYDRPLAFNPCIECKLCVSVCPVGAIGADGYFNFANCMTHNYRDRMGGFQDWVESTVLSNDVKGYRRRVMDSETVSMWQSLSYGICNKSSYCMAACPAGEEIIGTYLDNKKEYVKDVVKPLQNKVETIWVVSGTDAEAHVARRFPHKQIKCIGNGLRPNSVENFLGSLSLVFQRQHSEGLDATYHFTFTGGEECEATVVIRNKSIEVKDGHVGEPDLSVIADSRTWIDFLAKEKNLLLALVSRKLRMKGSPRLMKAFAGCFPG